jgi:hypothetical protein
MWGQYRLGGGEIQIVGVGVPKEGGSESKSKIGTENSEFRIQNDPLTLTLSPEYGGEGNERSTGRGGRGLVRRAAPDGSREERRMGSKGRE